MSLNVERIVTGPFQENSYVIWQDGSPSCLVIDPGDDPELIIETILGKGLHPIAVVNTHAHLDHIGGVSDLKEKYGIPFYLHPNEKSVLDGYERDCAFFGMTPKVTPTVDHWLNTGELKVGDFLIQCVETPGHTPGGTCLVINDHVFTGDTIFAGSVGRTDLPGGDWNTLCESLVKAMKEIPGDYILHPGHGLHTTLKNEMLKNPFLIPLLKRVNS
ncbi:MAG TPA: MBL fold metallo-hydrolase [Candidatus Marinimicrobia bacterium]|nr:MBL fold metallo-hydrolase [Candidatus Neomarinimicrobiota bacterium]